MAKRRYVPRIGTKFKTGELPRKMRVAGWTKVSGTGYIRERVIVIDWKADNKLVRIKSQQVPPFINYPRKRGPKNYWRVTDIQRG